MATHKLILNLGITVFKLSNYGSIPWDKCSENLFYGDARTTTQLGDNCVQTFYLGRYIMGLYGGEFSFAATL